MNWETFYLVCFLAGLMLSFVSLLGGMGHFGGHVHLPHVHVPHAGHVHIPHGAGAVHTTGGTGSTGVNAGPEVPWWNAFSIMIFLCWFGAAGYLLTKYGSFVAGVVVVLAAICGVAGGAIIFMFMNKFLMKYERELTSFETEVVGAVGRVSAPIRAGGTGEIVYEQLGATRSAIARSEDGAAIGKEEEVYVLRYERGIAYVKRWEEIRD
ncbi:NfeD family protein [Occallatibacter savannae]|uniref:NfeD family protein n=1 Tax=Occallatibacter savannae TaxID=1002691 RepID=UPI000D688B37|nr:NfeD family protein [Occallatibacter savannae]